jgi:hypothetical protein
MFQDRIIFSSNDTTLMLKMQDAGIMAIVEDRMTKQPGVVLYSHIGDGYGDGNSYALVTFDDTVWDMPTLDARLADSVDPTRTPLRVRAGTVIDDPDAEARQAFAAQQIADRATAFTDFKTTFVSAAPGKFIKP